MRTSETSSCSQGVMPRGSLWVAILFLALSVFAPAGQAQSGPLVWVARSLQRIGPDDAPGSNLQAQLSAARGEYESFQIVVRAPGSAALSNVNVSVSDLTGPGGAVIPRRNLSLFREQYVYVGTSSPNWSGSNRPLPKGWYPDGLIPFTDPQTGNPLSGAQLRAVPFSLNASKNQPIWVDVLVPRDATPGAYSGTFSVTSNQGNVSGQIALTVWSFTLPLKPALESSFLTWTTGSMATHQELLRNRLNPQKAAVADQRSLMDNFGLTSRDVGFWSGADISSCTMSASPTVSQFKAAAATHQSGLKLYDYSADEIWKCTNLYPTIKQWAANMHQAGIDNLITMAPVPELYDDGTGSGRSAVDIWVLLPLLYDKNPNNVQHVISKGDRVWSYSCLVQDAYSPKWLIDFDPMNFRVQPGFINQSLNLTGILYWRVDLWSSDPWNNVYSSSFPTYPGEGMLVYPGSTVGIQGVAPSMRLKWLRDGADDYDYIELLKQAGQGAWALQVAAGVGANWSQWSHDGNVAEAARLQLGQQLDALNGGSLNPPASPVNPSPQQAATGVPLAPTLAWTPADKATSYDVYFGTSSSPSMAGTTATANYSPGTLSANTTYYWRVVAKNSAGSTSSATWSFTTLQSAPPGGGGGAIALAQSNALRGTGARTLSVPFVSANTTGNLIIAAVRMSTTSQTVTVTDSAGNIYTDAVAQSQSTDGHQVHVFYAKNIAGRANTVTATFSATNSHPWLAVYEYSGLSATSPLDRTARAQGSGSAPGSGATATTVNANELVFAALGLPASYTGTVAASSGCAMQLQDTGSSRAANAAHMATSTGSYTGTFGLSAGTNWSAVVATFAAAAAAPPPSLPAVTTTALPGGTQGAAYTATLTATGGKTPYGWSIVSGSLPAGLTLGSSTGVISGTPSGSGTSTFSVQVKDANTQTAVKALSLTIAVSGGGGGIALVQSRAARGSGVSSISVPFASANTTGNLIIAAVRMSTTSQTVTVTDSAGNIYTDAVAQSQTMDGHQVHVFYAKNVAGRANTVTARFSAANGHPWLAVYEYRGLSATSPLDRTARAQGSGSTPTSGATPATVSANELVFAALGLPASYTGTVAASSGCAMQLQDTGSSRSANEAVVVTSTGSYAGTFGLSAGTNWSAVVATFKP